MTAWLDRIAADLLDIEQDLRTTLRDISRGRRTERELNDHYGSLRISFTEARTLLRGTMPSPIALTRLRGQHARLVAALSVLNGHLLMMNDPWHRNRTDAALDAACSVLDELREWVRITRWNAGTRRARIRWGAPVSKTSIMRLQSPPETEQLPNAYAGSLHHPSAGIRFVRQLANARAEQLALDLALPLSADVVDLRQLRLHLVASPPEAHHGTTAA